MPKFSHDQIAVISEFMLGEDLVRPGAWLKVRDTYGSVLYQCLVHDLKTDTTWALCKHNGEWRYFHIGRVKSLVIQKRSRRKVNAGIREG